MPSGLGSGLLEIAMALISVAFIAMLVSRGRETTQIIGAIGDTFSSVIEAATLNSKGY